MDQFYKFALAIAILAIGAFVVGFQEDTINQAETGAKQQADAYMEAFDVGQADKLAALWTEDAVYINFSTHETLQGRDEIRDYFEQEFEKQNGATLAITIDHISTKEDKVIEKGSAVVTSKNQEEHKSVFIAELVKVNDSWLLQKVVEVEIEAPLSHYEQLKELEWLMGDWSSKSDYIDFSSEFAWEDNKNFIQQRFSMEILDHKDLEGQQIIGWDPVNKKIRSWIFDSDGGYGEGSWTRQENRWYVGVAFTLPDGRRASATHIYTKTDGDSFIFTSENRYVDGKLLPNIQPLKINRTP